MTTSATGPARPRRRPGRLGDFTVTPRVLWICLWAIPVGALGAGAAWVLLKLIGLVTQLVFFGRWSFQLVSPGSGPHPWWLILGAPVLGGLVVGVMARFGSEKIRGHGMPEAIEAILIRRSRVDAKVAVLKPISTAVSIGTGGPFGAEGPIIMTGGALGSLLAQYLHLSADERKALMVGGAAAGMAATFNAPLASVLLAVELLLFEWRPRTFLPVATAVVVATLIRVPLLGGEPIFGLDTAGWHIGPVATIAAVVTGAVGGLLAVVVTSLVYLSEDAFGLLARWRVHWMWWPALGGLIIGLGGLVEPRALGVGYDVIDELLSGRAVLSLVIGILVVKSLIWGLSLGSGTAGGVLAPVFMIGAALGALESHVLPDVGPGFWALAGLAAVVGGVMRSPLTGVVFSLELTHAWPALLPLLVAATAAHGVSVLVLKRSVLTEKIARRGFHLSREYDVDPLEVLFVDEVMHDDPAVLPHGGPMHGSDDLLAAVVPRPGRGGDFPVAGPDGGGCRLRLFPIVGAGRHLHGVVTAHQLMGRASAEPVPDPLVVHPDDTLRRVRELFAAYGVSAAPVVTEGSPRLVGLITVEHLLDERLPDLAEEHHRSRSYPSAADTPTEALVDRNACA